MTISWCVTHQSELCPNWKTSCWKKVDWVYLEGDCRLVQALIYHGELPNAVYLEQRRNDDLRAALGKGRYAPWEQDIERLLNRDDWLLDVISKEHS